MDNQTASPAPEQKPSESTTVTENNTTKDEVVAESKHSNNKVLVIILAVLGVLVLIGVVGAVLLGVIFKKAASDIVETSTNSQGQSTVTTKIGDTTVTSSTEQKLPTDFPDNIPLYSGQKITSSYKSKNSTGNYWYLASEISDKTTEAASKIKSQYDSWELSNEVETDGTFVLSFKNDKYNVDVTITSDTNVTTLTYQVSEIAKTE